jgi:hypothetical protein
MIAPFDSGYLVSNDAAAVPLVAAAGFVQVTPAPLPAVKNLNPGAQITGSITYTLATIAVAIDLTLLLHCFAGDAQAQ